MTHSNHDEFPDDELIERLKEAPVDAQARGVVPPADVVWTRLAARMRESAGGSEPHIGAAKEQPRDRSRSRAGMGGPASWNSVAFGTQTLRRLVTGLAIAAVGVIAVSVTRHASPPSSVPAARRYATGAGELAIVRLADGSRVTLSVGSQLDVPADYAQGNRTLTLNGEAQFQVVAAAGAPFIVKSGTVTTQVLGTTFVVRHYSGDGTTTVAVRDGKVALGATVLSARQQVVVGPGITPVVSPVDDARFAFTDGVLALDNVALRHAIPDLHRWYGADVRLGDSLVARNVVTGRFKGGAPANLKSILELTFDARVVQQGKTLILYSRGERHGK